jgi:uncharacterized SAM-binding protein YcdF (DUF218 family)
LARGLIATEELPHAEAVVVFSGSAAYTERTKRAAELYKSGAGHLVLLTNDGQLSGWSVHKQRNPYFFERASEQLQADGVPSQHIEVLHAEISSTHDEVEAVRAFALERKITSLLFVTSAYHSRRALWTVERVFRGSGILVGLDYAPPTPGPWTWWLHIVGWKWVTSEYVKLLYYRVRF